MGEIAWSNLQQFVSVQSRMVVVLHTLVTAAWLHTCYYRYPDIFASMFDIKFATLVNKLGLLLNTCLIVMPCRGSLKWFNVTKGRVVTWLGQRNQGRHPMKWPLAMGTRLETLS